MQTAYEALMSTLMLMLLLLMLVRAQMYLFTKTKLAPEITSFTTKDMFGYTANDELYASWNDDYYILRPETVESIMILHRVTGDPVYREYGRTIMNAIETHCKVRASISTIRELLAADLVPTLCCSWKQEGIGAFRES